MEQFHEVFFEESFEGLDVMESGLLGLSLGAPDIEAINTIFRAAHSIKGGSGTFGFLAISDFTHVVETLLDEMRDGRREVTQQGVDLLLESVDCLRDMLSNARAGEDAHSQRAAQIQQRLETLLHSQQCAADEGAAQADVKQADAVAGWKIRFRPHEHLLLTGNDPVRILRELAGLGELGCQADVSRLPGLTALNPEQSYLGWELTLRGDITREAIAEIFEWVEDDCDLEIVPVASQAPDDPRADDVPIPDPAPTQAAVAHNAKPPAEAPPRPAERTAQSAAKDSGSIRVNIDKVDELINIVGELVITQSMLSQLGENLESGNFERLRDGLEQLERNTRELQESVMQIRMLPISFSFNRFPRLVRDLSQKLDKKVELRLSGEQTEIDKTVLEKIGDPLVHLVRNSLDHGIESPQTRKAAGKPETGVVHLNAYHQGGNVVIEISDDGAGLNRDKILDKAVQRGLLGTEDNVPDEQVYDLIFHPGFSTADQVSDVSGRGVGMDVVRRNIKDLGGTVEVSSRPGEGSTFTIRLPLTLAILDGQLVRVGSEIYIIPLVSIIESLQIKSQRVNSIVGQVELYKLRQDYIPIVRLYDVFNLKPESTELADGLLVVVDGDGKKAGVFVDELLGQQQVVIKSLETNYQGVTGISGATILGDGTVALILDITGVIDCARHGPDDSCDGEEIARAVA